MLTTLPDIYFLCDWDAGRVSNHSLHAEIEGDIKPPHLYRHVTVHTELSKRYSVVCGIQIKYKFFNTNHTNSTISYQVANDVWYFLHIMTYV